MKTSIPVPESIRPRVAGACEQIEQGEINVPFGSPSLLSIPDGLIPNVSQGGFERLGQIAVHGAKEKAGYLCLQRPCWRNRRHRPGPPMAERPVALPPEEGDGHDSSLPHRHCPSDPTALAISFTHWQSPSSSKRQWPWRRSLPALQRIRIYRSQAVRLLRQRAGSPPLAVPRLRS
jgi:hypothetical protein